MFSGLVLSVEQFYAIIQLYSIALKQFLVVQNQVASHIWDFLS